MKEFISAIEEAEQTEEPGEVPLEFMLDGHELKAYRPTDGQLALLMSSLSRHTSMNTKIAGCIDFFVEVLDPDSHAYVVGRLLSRENPIPFEKVQEIIEWMSEEWTGRPTQRPSGSTPSQRSGGQRSRRTTSRSTSLESAPVSS